MTEQEFTTRTKVEIADNRPWAISYNEFAAIHTVYMCSDLDKDAFCKAWVKMNTQRIKGFKIAYAHHIEKLHLNSRLYAIREKLRDATNTGRFRHAVWYLTEQDITDLKSVGISTDQTHWGVISDIDNHFAA